MGFKISVDLQCHYFSIMGICSLYSILSVGIVSAYITSSV